MTRHRIGFPSAVKICAQVQRLAYAAARRIRLYGEKFKVVSDPMSSAEWGCSSSDDEKRATHSPSAHSGGCASE
jgi:hypothetical protein